MMLNPGAGQFYFESRLHPKNLGGRLLILFSFSFFSSLPLLFLFLLFFLLLIFLPFLLLFLLLLSFRLHLILLLPIMWIYAITTNKQKNLTFLCCSCSHLVRIMTLKTCVHIKDIIPKIYKLLQFWYRKAFRKPHETKTKN